MDSKGIQLVLRIESTKEYPEIHSYFIGIKDVYALQCMCTELKKQLQKNSENIMD